MSYHDLDKVKQEDDDMIAARLLDTADILEARSQLKAAACREAADRLLAREVAEAKAEAALALLDSPLDGMRVEGEGFAWTFKNDPRHLPEGWWNLIGSANKKWVYHVEFLPTLRALVKHGAATVRLPQQEEGEA